MNSSQQIFFPRPGEAVIREVEVPDPAADEVQVRCVANGICMFEVSVFNGIEPITRLSHGQAGHEGIGVVAKTGKDVKHLREGDWIVCRTWSTLQNLSAANLATYAITPPDPSVLFAEPSACVVTALHSYRVAPGDRALVLGCGYMGLLNVQGLAHSPLADLVVADIAPKKLELAQKFGATEVINSGTEEGRARLQELQHEPFDLVVECAGVPATLKMAANLTRIGGRLAIFAWHHQPRAVDLGEWHMRGLQVLNCAPMIGADYTLDAMQRAVRLLERGVFDQKPLVTHRHHIKDVQQAMEEAAARRDDYVKGVLLFE